MNRPEKTILTKGVPFSCSVIADAIFAAQNIPIGNQSSVDKSVSYTVYFKPRFVAMTQRVWYNVKKSRDCMNFINMYDPEGSGYTFMGLPVLILAQTGNLKEEWFEIT